MALAKQGAGETRATGLTIAGAYVFELAVVDRTKFARKEVTVTVVAE